MGPGKNAVLGSKHRITDLEREKTPRQPTDLEREKTPQWRALRTKPPRGGTLSPDAWKILDSVSRRTGHNLEVQQGGHNAAGDPTSKGTHDGGGAVDLFVKGMSKQERLDVVAELRNQGAAAWLRTPEYGWNVPNDDHIHAIFMDDPELAPVAVEQVRQYNKGLNGLANHAPDPFKNLKASPRSTIQTVMSTQQSGIERAPRRRRGPTDLEWEKTPRQLKPIPSDLEREKTPNKDNIQFDDEKVDTSNVKVLGRNANQGIGWQELGRESRQRILRERLANRSGWQKFLGFFTGNPAPELKFNEGPAPKPLEFDLDASIRRARDQMQAWEKMQARSREARKKAWDDFMKRQPLPKKEKIPQRRK